MVRPVIGVGSTRRGRQCTTCRQFGHSKHDLPKFLIPNSQQAGNKHNGNGHDSSRGFGFYRAVCVGSGGDAASRRKQRAGRNRVVAPAVFCTVVNSRQVSLNEVWTEASLWSVRHAPHSKACTAFDTIDTSSLMEMRAKYKDHHSGIVWIWPGGPGRRGWRRWDSRMPWERTSC
jgi:hypothetical protein